jgi:quinohemoprotein ethanol dehydrogenase
MSTKHVLFLLLLVIGQDAQLAETAVAPAFADTDLTAYPTSDWPTNGGDWFNRRHSPLNQINRSNVSKLKGVWRARLDGSGSLAKYSGEAQPIVYDGVIYVITGADDVFAYSVETGERLWKYSANLDQTINTVCCGWTSRGVALGEGKIFVGQLDGKLVALDQHSGSIQWSVQAERWQEGFTITSAPLYYDGLVISGFAGADLGVRGRVKAYDAATGDLVWTFYTIPGPGEPGHETWPADNDAWKYGGANVWQTPAVDPELGLLYFSTANPGPDFNGSLRAGDNLYSSSIVAVDVRSGEYRWHFQQVHHDLWDFDAPAPVVLFDIEIAGKKRKGLAQAGKTGWVYILDRTDGTPLIGIEERPVPQEPRQLTSPTQPYPLGDSFVPQSIDIAPEGFELVNGGRIFTPFWTERAIVSKPNSLGGNNWPPSSFDPATNSLFVCARDGIMAFRAGEMTEESRQEGEFYLGFGAVDQAKLPNLGVLAALDMQTNKLIWQQHWPDVCYSGTVNTAGGLLFIGRNDGRFTALDSSTGELLWEHQTGAGLNAPASVFTHKGIQYVAAYSAGNFHVGSPRGDSLWLFSLNGSLDPVPRSGMEDGFAALALDHVVSAENGLLVYFHSCMSCHGLKGDGGHGGGIQLQGGDYASADVLEILSNGRGTMPTFINSLTPKQARDVSEFVMQNFAKK